MEDVLKVKHSGRLHVGGSTLAIPGIEAQKKRVDGVESPRQSTSDVGYSYLSSGS